MTSTLPTCTCCARTYTIPSVLPENGGLCESCRPFPVCGRCNGHGDRWVPSMKGGHRGKWEKCDRCSGTRHERHRRGEAPTP